MVFLHFMHKHMCFIVTNADYGSFVCQCFARHFGYYIYVYIFFSNKHVMGAMSVICWAVFFLSYTYDVFLPRVYVRHNFPQFMLLMGVDTTVPLYTIYHCSDDIIFIHRFVVRQCCTYTIVTYKKGQNLNSHNNNNKNGKMEDVKTKTGNA